MKNGMQVVCAFCAFVALSVAAFVPGAYAEAPIVVSDEVLYDASASADQKQIAVVEPRPFTKEGRGELMLGLGTIASDVFLVYLPLTLRGAYHIKEWMSVEASASFMGCYSDAVGPNLERAADQRCQRVLKSSYRNLTEQNLDMTHVSHVVMKEYQTARFAINPVWSPIVGKFALANDAIAHFDLNFTAGLGAVIVEKITDEVGNRATKASFEGNLGAGVRFVFMDMLGVRLDFRQYLYGKQDDEGLATASELTLGFSVLL